MKEKNKLWSIISPILALVLIGGAVTAALAVTNEITKPIIEKQQSQAADSAKLAVLPEGADFTQVELASIAGLPGEVQEIYAAGNGAGYVITTETKGFGGAVRAMFGVDASGAITGSQVLEHEETEGIGSNVVADGSDYQKQLVGMTDTSNIQAVSGATRSSNAMKTAVQAVFDAYTLLTGGTVEPVELPTYDPPANLTDDVLAQYYPGAVFTDVPGGKVSDAGTVVYAGEMGMTGPVPVAVLFGADDSILAVVADTSAETPGIGQPLGEDGFTDGFVGVSSGDEVDGVAGATLTSNGIKDGVNYAISILQIVKGAG